MQALPVPPDPCAPAPVPVRRVRTRRERLPRVRGHQERLTPCPPFLTIQLRAPAGKELKTEKEDDLKVRSKGGRWMDG